MSIADDGPAPSGKKKQGNLEGTQKKESESRTPRLPSKRMELLFQRFKDQNQRFKQLKKSN